LFAGERRKKELYSDKGGGKVRSGFLTGKSDMQLMHHVSTGLKKEERMPNQKLLN